jgi:hypothetical protein
MEEMQGMETTTGGTDAVPVVDEEEAGFRATEARIAKRRAERAKQEEEHKRGGGMAAIVFSDDGERGPETSAVARGLPPLREDNDLPASIGVPSTARGVPVDEHP